MAICETREDVTKGIANVLDKFLSDHVKDRVEFIDDLIHMLQFERRLSLLTDEQIAHMNNNLSIQQRKRLDNCSNEKERDVVFAEYARLSYFRECAWVSYLNGHTDKPPVGEAVKQWKE